MIDKSEILELLCDLIRIESHYYNEAEAMKFCYEWLSAAGFAPVMHEYSEKKAANFDGKNIIVRYVGKSCEQSARGEGNPCTIHLNGHLDTVPLCKGWTKNPYSPKLAEDGKLYGLGALDMKSGCVANMIALKEFDRYLAREGKTFEGEIILTLVSDEEGPFGLGANALIEEDLLGMVDCSIITEPTAGFSHTEGFPLLCLGARGCYVYYVDFFGKSAHASQPETGINAVIEASKFIVEAEKVELSSADPLGSGSLCILKIEGDGGACSVPDFARVYIHRHITMGESEEFIRMQTEALIKKAGVKCEYSFGERPYPSEGSKYYAPYYVEEDNKYTRLFVEAIKSACDREPAIGYFSSIGDFNYLGTRVKNREGELAPALIFGPDGANMHGADEYVLIDSVYKTAESVFEFLKKVYGV